MCYVSSPAISYSGGDGSSRREPRWASRSLECAFRDHTGPVLSLRIPISKVRSFYTHMGCRNRFHTQSSETAKEPRKEDKETGSQSKSFFPPWLLWHISSRNTVLTDMCTTWLKVNLMSIHQQQSAQKLN